MTYPSVGLEVAMRVAGLVASLGVVWDALELLIARRELLQMFFDWKVVRSRYYILLRRPLLKTAFDAVLSGRAFDSLLVLHAVAALAFSVVLPFSHSLAALLAASVLFGHLCIHLRLLVGMDGADQMQTIVWTGLLVYCLDLGPVANAAAGLFICAELVLSYLISGSAKLASPVWRAGTAIARITRTGTYCPPGLSKALQPRIVSMALSWGVICFELVGPLALLAGRPGALAFIAVGAAFHIGIALSMGLSTFVFAFVAAYPVLYAMVCA